MATLADLMAGKKPTVAEVAAAPVVEEWRLQADVVRGRHDMHGVITGFSDVQHRVIKLDVLYVDPELRWFLIEHGFYGLGKRAGATDD